MSLLRPRVRDDRGRRTRLGVPIGAVPIALGVIFLGVTLTIGAMVAADFTYGALVCLGIAAVPCLVYFAVILCWGSERLPAIADAKAHRRCAACGYDLGSCRVDADGCTVCPECGAAWRLEREETKGQRDEGTLGEA